MKKTKRLRGDTLQNLIEKAGYKITEFCKESGVPTSTLYSYLTEGREPSLKHTVSIAKTLKISLKEVARLLGKDVTGIPKDE
jgi:predicted transcriptional regulator